MLRACFPQRYIRSLPVVLLPEFRRRDARHASHHLAAATPSDLSHCRCCGRSCQCVAFSRDSRLRSAAFPPCFCRRCYRSPTTRQQIPIPHCQLRPFPLQQQTTQVQNAERRTRNTHRAFGQEATRGYPRTRTRWSGIPGRSLPTTASASASCHYSLCYFHPLFDLGLIFVNSEIFSPIFQIWKKSCAAESATGSDSD